MKWKNRLTNYNFWISIVSAVLLILQAFNINFDIAYINEIATAVLGLLVVIGIINDPTRSAAQTTTEEAKHVEYKEENTETNPVEAKTEEMVKEENNIPFNAENENDSNNSEIDFKAIIETISADIKNKIDEIITQAKKESYIAVEEVDVVENNNIQKQIEEKEILTSQTEQICYNIVN